jgi:cytochrome c553
MKQFARTILVLLAAATTATVAVPARAADEPKFSPADLDFFEKQVRPLLAEHCFKCHNDKKQKGGLRLDARQFVMKGGDHGPAIDPANPTDPAKSPLVRAVQYTDEDMQMPPDGKLPAAKIEVLTKWAKLNAPWPPGEQVAATVKPVTPHEDDPANLDPEKNRGYWAYKPVVRPAVPTVKDPQVAAWVKNPVDAFIAAKLESAGLKPNGRADKTALIRRAYFDLIGLPPTPEQIDAFVADQSPDAWEKLIDQLLASPHYGEKWGRHWLDLVRFAETHGYERDSVKPFAWRYRDYVIRSFNEDKPYDRFLKEQIAGDELDEVTPDTMIATGFYRLGIWDDEPADRPLARYDVLDGIVSTTGSVVLGMSVGCARCHDHKKDPIPAKDYYRLLAFFQDVTDMNKTNLKLVQDDRGKQAAEKAAADRQQKEAELFRQAYTIRREFLAAAKTKGIDLGDLAGGDLVDLSYKFYRDTFDTLPDFAALRFEDAGPVPEALISLAPASRDNAIGLVFDGKLKVPTDGTYTFHLRATEGARLTVAGKVVADRPMKGKNNGDFTVDLKAGTQTFKLEYFNSNAEPELYLAWTGADFQRRALSRGREASGSVAAILPDARTTPQPWQYTTTAQQPGWEKPDFKPKGWFQGPGGFGTKGTPGSVVNTAWRTPEIYLRRSFTLEAVPTQLSLTLHHDEDIEVYLNGVLAYRAEGFLREYQTVPVAAEAMKVLVPGRNVIAVKCVQRGGGQYVDVGLAAPSRGASFADLLARHGPATIGAVKVAEYARINTEIDALRKATLPPTGIEVMCVSETGKSRPTFVLIRGNPGSEGAPVTPGFPQVLTPPGTPSPTLPEKGVNGSSGKRRVLAEWLASDRNPLTARVMANRIWQYHFGRGIVPSPNEFGRLGEAATHPELLDWLASEFVAGKWSMKRMHRMLMTSNAYQMSARANAAAIAADPANNLFWRFNMRRLGAEEVRDTMLAVSGRLNAEMFGPGVYPAIPKEVLAGQSRPGDGWGRSTPEQASRRSVYVHQKRSLLVPILNMHDQADTDSSCPVRFTTTVPTQALGMLNGEFSNEQARLLADRASREAPGDLTAQVRRIIRLTTGRVPDEREVQDDVAFIAKLKTEEKLPDAEALRLYSLLALNTNEFMYLE